MLLVLYYYYYAKRETKDDDQIRRFSLCIPVSVAASVNPKEIKTILLNGLSTFFISCNPVFSNGPRGLPRNPPVCILLNPPDPNYQINIT